MKDDALLIVTERENAQRLKEEILKKSNIPDIQIVEKKCMLLITGMDAVTTEEEITGAIERETQLTDKTKVQIKTMYRNRAGEQVATLEITKELADKLLESGTICRIKEKVTIMRCSNCLKMGHSAKFCKAKKTEGVKCMKCTQEGHAARDCQNESYCTTCSTEGHRTNEIKVTESTKGRCFVRVSDEKTSFYSVYLSPNDNLEVFIQKLQEIQEDIETTVHKQIVIGGDFNAKSFAWGSPFEDRRGAVLGEWFASRDLVILNRGATPTFVRNSIISHLDITACSQALANQIESWEVLMEENLSDHNTIRFVITEPNRRQSNPRNHSALVWKYDEAKENILQEKITAAVGSANTNPRASIQFLQEICREIFEKRRPRSDKQQAYWWNSHISNLRKVCLKLRRKLVRENGRRTRRETQAARNREMYYDKKKELKKAIRNAQQESWKKLCNDLNHNIWGNGYKIVCKKFKINTTNNLNTDEKLKIAKKLFPVHELPEWNKAEIPPAEIPPFTIDELLQTYMEIKNKKAPGPDGIVPEVTKVLIKTAPDYCLALFNQLAKEGRFPDEWKIAKLVLIEKEKKPTDAEKSFRPLCLLDGMGKVYEKLLKIRIEKEIENNGGLSPLQYGFTSGKSTIDAIMEVKRIAKEAKEKNKLCVMTMVDVRNAFGSVPWKGILEELTRKNISKYLINILADYFHNRKILVDDKSMPLTCGVPQGSVLGALIWNIYYDPILKINLPNNTKPIAYADDLYADDLALLTTGSDKEMIEMEIKLAMLKVNNWMTEKQLEIAPHKTEIVMLASKRAIPEVKVEISGNNIRSKDSAKYLGVYLDTNLRMTEHIRKVSKKAEGIAANLARIMPNIAGPQNRKRDMLGYVVYSTLFYGVPAWFETAQIKKYKYKLEKVQRKVMLRQCRSYRTTSTVALQVISGTLPIEYMAEERARIYKAKKLNNPEILPQLKDDLKRELVGKWQRKWNEETTKGQWTKTLIRNIETWINRNHGEITYELCQFLTGHGNFGAYLKRMKIQESDRCIYCQDEEDTPKHMFFQCDRWRMKRTTCWETLGAVQTEQTIIAEMIKDKTRWNCASNFISEIVKNKKMDTQRLAAQADARPTTPQ
ncbi:hypothetical protein M8J77_023429 [Diaphorina citri]|nr:hypothetical protein M8J77_023429 [Diaphorina citri]